MATPVIIILLVIYFYVLLIFIYYLEIERDPETSGDRKAVSRGVSIVVPFRNEAAHIGQLSGDLKKQSYRGDWEVLFVDDHSSDDSFKILEPSISELATFHCQRLPDGIYGKKEAVSFGVQHAAYDWIIQLDADCRINSAYIAAQMEFLDSHPSDLVAGMVTTGRIGGKFLETFERLDLLSLIGIGAGSFSLGRPMMCSGANLSYSRELYNETRKFDPGPSVPSGDDMFLMIGARRLGKKLSFNTLRDSLVRTAPVKSWSALIAQRIRWGAKTGRYRMPDIQLLALLVSLTNLSVILLPLWLVLYTSWWPWLAGAWALKTLTDFVLLCRMTGMTGARKDLIRFLPVALLYYPYFMITVFGAFRGKVIWKDDIK